VSKLLVLHLTILWAIDEGEITKRALLVTMDEDIGLSVIDRKMFTTIGGNR